MEEVELKVTNKHVKELAEQLKVRIEQLERELNDARTTYFALMYTADKMSRVDSIKM